MKSLSFYNVFLLHLKNITRTFIKYVLGRGIGSQFGEDELLLKLLPENGFYVDVGAYHPHLYSNTFAFYRKGWRGMVIEPNKAMKVLFRLFRPRDVFIHGGIGSGILWYSLYADGAYNGFNAKVPDRVKLIDRQIVHCRPLSEIVQGISRIDFLNVDVEGMDLEVLRSHNWSIPTDVIAVEGDEKSPAADFLLEKGYNLCAIKGKTLVFKYSA